MEVQFTPEQEAQLAQTATEAGAEQMDNAGTLP
jgi:hypothetical protein